MQLDKGYKSGKMYFVQVYLLMPLLTFGISILEVQTLFYFRHIFHTQHNEQEFLFLIILFFAYTSFNILCIILCALWLHKLRLSWVSALAQIILYPAVSTLLAFFIEWFAHYFQLYVNLRFKEDDLIFGFFIGVSLLVMMYLALIGIHASKAKRELLAAVSIIATLAPLCFQWLMIFLILLWE